MKRQGIIRRQDGLGVVTTGPGQPDVASSGAEREEKGDPRLSIEERYSSREDYLFPVQQAAQTLTDEGYLLPEDIALLVSHAAERYEALTGRALVPQAAND